MKSIIKTTYSIIVMLLSFAATAQTNVSDKGDRVEALRVAFIAEQLNITPAEAQKFWPIYNQYRNDIETLRKNFRLQPDQELTADQQIDMAQKKLDLKKKYKIQFENSLGKEKVDRLYNLENEFNQKVKATRDQRQQQKK